jgi:predicted XRE-type DNA-binding protein
MTLRPTAGHQSNGKHRTAHHETAARAALIRAISHSISRRRLTQARAAKILGIDQPSVSSLLHGRRHYTTDKLMLFLTRLGCDVEIVLRPAASRARGRLSVVT